MSEKAVHGKNGDNIENHEDKKKAEPPISEKLMHGELLKTNVPLSEKVVSEEVVSEKSVHGNFGHANIKNKIKTNSSLEKEQNKNQQGKMRDDKNPV